jgi:signal transduction histidine kinase
MTELHLAYIEGVSAYVSTGAEQSLLDIEELGRTVVDQGKPFEELAELHAAAMLALSERGVGCNEPQTILRASTCLAALMISSAVGYRARVDLVEYHRARAYAERSRQRLESVGLLIGGMAHEISNLLQPISGLCELALLDLAPEAPERETLDIIAGCAQRSARVLRKVLAFGRFDASAAQPAPLGPAVRRGLDFVASVSMHWPELVTNIADDSSQAIVVEDELTQILLNLVQNAAQANATRISVTVTNAVWRFPAKARPAPALRLTITDNGCGMDAQTLSRASEPFFSSKPSGEGSGMGLAVVSGIIESWSGHLTMSSQLGGGTTVAIYLPVES